MLKSNKVRLSLELDPEFVYLRRYEFSVTKLLERYPDGVPDHIIAAGLLLAEDDVERIYQDAVDKLRQHMKIEASG